MNWLINRKKYKPFIYIITIVVYAANMALLMICVRFAYCIIKGIQTDWYKKAELTASRDDMFFADKSQVVFFTLAIVFVFIILFALLVILGYRRLLFENMKRDTAVLFIQGYREEKILLFFMTDVMADILISIPLANLFMGIIIIKICENSMYQTIFAQEERKLLFIAGYLVIPIIMSACAFFVQTKIWIKKMYQQGLAQMTRQGI